MGVYKGSCWIVRPHEAMDATLRILRVGSSNLSERASNISGLGMLCRNWLDTFAAQLDTYVLFLLPEWVELLHDADHAFGCVRHLRIVDRHRKGFLS